MSQRFEAHYENRIYYFFITDKKDTELSIDMYKTPYTFIKKDGQWQNIASNKMQMIAPLVQIVAEAARL